MCPAPILPSRTRKKEGKIPSPARPWGLGLLQVQRTQVSRTEGPLGQSSTLDARSPCPKPGRQAGQCQAWAGIRGFLAWPWGWSCPDSFDPEARPRWLKAPAASPRGPRQETTPFFPSFHLQPLERGPKKKEPQLQPLGLLPRHLPAAGPPCRGFTPQAVSALSAGEASHCGRPGWRLGRDRSPSDATRDFDVGPGQV